MLDNDLGKQCFTDGNAFRIPYDEERAAEELAASLDVALQDAKGKNVAIVCVGTDRSTGDAFGPIVGSKLASALQFKNVSLYGTLDAPVHAMNLASTLDYIDESFPERPYILAIDACLGKFDHVGHLILEHGPLRPGAGVKKSLPEFGDFTLTGVVNVSGFMEYFVLQNTRLGIVMQMTDVVVEALKLSLFRFQTQRSIHQMMKNELNA